MLKEKGVSLYLSIVVMSLLLAIVLGMSAILTAQFKLIRDSEKSVAALYASDAGIEKSLIDIIHNGAIPQASYTGSLDNGASYVVQVKCCQPSVGQCKATVARCAGLAQDASCSANFYCVKSVGKYKETIRGVSVNI